MGICTESTLAACATPHDKKWLKFFKFFLKYPPGKLLPLRNSENIGVAVKTFVRYRLAQSTISSQAQSGRHSSSS